MLAILPVLASATPNLSRLPGPKRITQSLNVLPVSMCLPLKTKAVQGASDVGDTLPYTHG